MQHHAAHRQRRCAHNLADRAARFPTLYAIYHTILEGNRVVNNIQRSASLFLVKTIFSCALCVLFMLLPLSYPFVPVQLTLFSSLCIGIPSFLLTLQHNYRSN